MATTIVFYILMGLIGLVNGPTTESSLPLVNGQTTESSLPTSFMGYPVEYEDIDIYSCATETTTIVPDDTSTMCLTSDTTTIAPSSSILTTAATTSVSTATTGTTAASTSTATVITSIASTAALPTSNVAFVPPTCANQNLGSSCNISSDGCALIQPCFNLATCYPNASLPLGYACSCVSGFSGVNCEVDKRTCRPGLTCINGGTCNETSNETNCICPRGKTGLHCESEVDVCSNISCQNKGQCISSYGNWSCLCTNPTLYSGLYCQTESSSLRTKQMVSRSFAGVAIGCIATVITFVLIMDILKYLFHINPVDKNFRTDKEKKANQRLQERKKKKIHKSKQPVIAVRFQYIHA